MKRTHKGAILAISSALILGFAQPTLSSENIKADVDVMAELKAAEARIVKRNKNPEDIHRTLKQLSRQGSHPISHQLKRAEPTKASFSVTASGVVEQDLIRITLFSQVDAVDEREVNARLIKDMQLALSSMGSSEGASVSGDNFRVWPSYDSSQQISSWRGRAQLVIESNDFELASKLASNVADHMAIANITYLVSDERRAQAENELIEKAGELFKDRAKALTGSLGFDRYKISGITLNHHGHMPPMPRPVARMASFESASVDVAAPTPGGEERVSIVMSGSIDMVKKKRKRHHRYVK